MPTMNTLTKAVLLPSIVLMIAVWIIAHRLRLERLTNRIWTGIWVGAVATAALDIIRLPGFALEWMPSNNPRMFGVLILDQMARGPSDFSDFVGLLFMRNGLLGILLACFLAVPAAHAAEVVAPDVLAKNVTAEVLAILRADKDIQAGDSRKAAELIETRILPHFGFPTMTRLAVGKNWAQASPEQRQALTNEFRTLLVRTYTASLTLYRGQTIEYRPLKLAPGDTDVVVKSTIRQAGREPISIDYGMEKTESGWKVYDIKIAGISLVENYRSTFSAEIQRGGIDGLIKALAEKNRALAGKNKAMVQTQEFVGLSEIRWKISRR